MRKALFLFLLGVGTGILYTTNDDFKNWVDEGLGMAKEGASEWVDGAKKSALEQKDIALDELKSSIEEKKDEVVEELEKIQE